MTQQHYRTFTPDLNVRSAGDGRTVYGIAVPYNTSTRIHADLTEQFARGAFNHQLRDPQRVRFSREHALLGGEIIGAATMLRDDAAGLYVELRASKTPRGDETLELIKDGALNQLSVHFEERQNRRLPGNVVQRVSANLREVAAVMQGAYGDLAAPAGVRSVQPDEDEVDPELRELQFFTLPDRRNVDTELQNIHLGIQF
jgi:Escherichia/Staphylococcus phage prohead protease